MECGKTIDLLGKATGSKMVKSVKEHLKMGNWMESVFVMQRMVVFHRRVPGFMEFSKNDQII